MERFGTVLSKLVSRVRAMKLNSSHCSLADDGSSSQFYWSDARRIHSDPGADLEEIAAGRDDAIHQQPHHVASEICEDEDDSVFLSSCEQASDEQSPSAEFHTTCGGQFFFDWEEWQIPMEEILLRSIVSCNGCETVYNGYWHGNVQVHTRRMKEVENICSFLHEVTTLSCIRHENIQLFMGASLDLSQERVAVVMSELKGYTLHARLHTYGHAFTNPSKTRIIKQITEGMAYLHAKNIPHGLLTTQSITLNSRVCICLAANTSYVRNREFHPHQLTYLPPEFVRELYIAHSKLNEFVFTSVCGLRHHSSNKWRPVFRATLRKRPTFEADVFAFGTIVYELMTLSHPYNSLPFERLVWRVGNGETQPLNLVQKGRFRITIAKCWNNNITLRPSFQKLLVSLEHDMTLCDVTGTSLTRSRSLPSIHNSG